MRMRRWLCSRRWLRSALRDDGVGNVEVFCDIRNPRIVEVGAGLVVDQLPRSEERSGREFWCTLPFDLQVEIAAIALLRRGGRCLGLTDLLLQAVDLDCRAWIWA